MNYNVETIDLCSDDDETEGGGVAPPLDPILLQFNPSNTASGVTNSLPTFGEIGGSAPGFVVGRGGTHHFHEPDLHRLPDSWTCHPSTSGPCHPSTSGPCHPSTSGTLHPSATEPCLPSASGPGQICRQFWKAGDYTPSLNYAAAPSAGGAQNRMLVHPKFLHSNATSHKWAFGAIAELLDNAVDEVVNGATFVKVDKLLNPKDGSFCLLIQDDGGGMGPGSLRRCMGFGYSDKCTGSSIGQYGNGFKTSTMRLGADVIVFSRCLKERGFTQSVGLLSYTLNRNSGRQDIILPIVDYEFEPTCGIFKRLCRTDEKKFFSNLSILLSWSPFGAELELQKQFDEIGAHGTRIVVFNLWLNDAGEMELDFKSDNQDIMISGSPRVETTNKNQLLNQMHIANQYRYSLRVYASILYLHLPQGFRIIICGRIVDPHSVVSDLMYRECIKYRPQVGHIFEAEVDTVIGFLKGAPNLNIHGFCIYHRNRLILPFMPAVHGTGGRPKGVAGVLEANFINPTHDKQDFEKSALFQKLEIRLRDMVKEYWNYHCHLVGYKEGKNVPSKHSTNPPSCTDSGHEAILTSLPNSPTENPEQSLHGHNLHEPLANHPSSSGSNDLSHLFQPVLLGKRCQPGVLDATGASRAKRHGVVAPALQNTSHAAHATRGMDEVQREQLRRLVNENNKLRSQCSEYEASEKELSVKVQMLMLELRKARDLYQHLLAAQARIFEQTCIGV
ncbi:MORC family CW-type zinc finger protein 4 [Rhynchospora pubera]|uniref:MORC family CW-type zinc finger protein 4 n=1 Tax=Rhynchospora pubera TaxID=906938 RepID=A0AAV8DN15_9POAL|nr:MORC family CW-type zinc finger protein 4 [Rhynchospora pubera]